MAPASPSSPWRATPSRVAFLAAIVSVVLMAPGNARADAVAGAWGPVIAWPHIAVSMANLPDGRILTWSGSERTTWPTTEQTYSATWDPATGVFFEVFHDGHNMFCAHLAMTEDGKVFVNGGRNQTNSPWTSLFDFQDNQWTQVENMVTGGRWYPTTLALPGGSVMTSMGTASNFRNPEKWSPARSWSVLNGIDYNDIRQTRAGTDGQNRWWPILSVAPSGDVFHFWDSDESFFLATDGVGSYQNANAVSDDAGHSPGVAIQFDVGKLLVAGSNQGTWEQAASLEAFVIDMNGPAPQISTTDPLHFARRFQNMVPLPTGEVLVIGGQTGSAFTDDGSVFEAEIWNPATGEWRVGAAMNIPRNYHSTALLLTDGRVLAAGGGYGASQEIPGNHQDGQVYSPPYLFAPDGSPAVRPSITGGPGIVEAGDAFAVSATPGVVSFTMLKMSAVTHAVNTDARFDRVAFTEDSPGSYTLTAHANPNVLLPGYWMLFALDSQGVPSEAHVVRVQRKPTPGPNRFVRLVALGEVNGNPWASAAEFGLLDANGESIDRSAWVASADSEDANGIAGDAIDGYAQTFWHTEFQASNPPHPHELVVDLGTGFELSGFSYLPRQDGPNGRITDYEFSVSSDGVSWGPPVATGTFAYDAPDRAEFVFDVTDADDYAIEGGVYASSGTNDSFFVKVDGAPVDGYLWDTQQNTNYADDFVNERNGADPVVVNLSPGLHRLTVYLREDGTRLDDLRLVNLGAGSSPGTIEAEDAALFGAFEVGADAAASGGLYVHVPDGFGGGTASDQSTLQEVIFDPSTPLGDIVVTANAAAASGSAVAYSATPGTNLLYEWSAGDGTPTTGFGTATDFIHSFAQPGRYNVVLNVRDVLSGEERSIAVTQIVYDPAIDPNSDALRRLASSSVVFHTTRDEIWNVNPDNDTVTVIDASLHVKLAEIPVGDDPRALAVAPDGRVWVVNKGSADIDVIDPGTRSLVQTSAAGIGAGSGPHGLVFAPGGGAAFVALEEVGEVAKLDALTLAWLGTADVGARPRHLAIAADGSKLYVSRFITPPIPGEDTDAPDPAGAGGEVVVLDPSDLSPGPTILVEHSDDMATENTGPGLPNYLGPLALSPAGGVGYLPSKQDNVLTGVQRNSVALTFDQTVRAISSKLDLVAGLESTAERIDHDNASVASHAAFGPYGIHLFTALEGNRQVAVSDVHVDTEIIRFDVGRGPQGLALSADGDTLVVHNFLDRTVSIVDVGGVVNFGDLAVTPIATVPTVSVEALDPTVLLGKQHFYDARDDRLAALDYMSCASCHNAAGADGRTWDFDQFGEGLRNTITLRGHGSGHGRLHWTANFDEVQDFEGQIRAFALGQGLMTNEDFLAGTRSQPLGDPKAGLSADLDALAAYVESLTSVGPSPHRALGGALTPEGVSGSLLFRAEGCVYCHVGVSFTDSVAGLTHDVGTLTATSGPQTELDTPSLIGVWGTAPYLHDGSAPTLSDAIAAHTELDLTLTQAEVDDLASYVAQVDGSTQGRGACGLGAELVLALPLLIGLRRRWHSRAA